MYHSNHKLQCDMRRLRHYLEQSLTTAEEAELESHLDQCVACRQQISEWAAEQQWWTSAGRYLRPDAWDEEPGARPSGTSAASSAQPEPRSDEIIFQQFQQWLGPTDDPRFVGRFGGYEILGVIGHGGMGVVLKGFEPTLNRYVAIKVLAPSLATNGAARRRFAREAQAAAAVLHENVIAIHRVAESDGLPYLVMPYVSGVTLQQRMDQEGPLPLLAILRISRQIAAGLAAAHAQGLVHRDIKPSNILLERGVERVTITDFGLARAADDASLTRTGVIAGTPQFMSPEQSRGDSIDARSDLFSLGSVIYAMCTGHPPFRAETGYGILRRITDAHPRSIREINPEVPDWLEAIVGKLQAKSPGDRFETAEELAELLEGCLEHVQQPTRTPLPATIPPLSPQPGKARHGFGHRAPGWSMALIALVVAALTGLLGLSSKWYSGKPDATDMADEARGTDGAVKGSRELIGEQQGTPPWEDGIQERLETLSQQLQRLKESSLGDPSLPASVREESPLAGLGRAGEGPDRVSNPTTLDAAEESNPNADDSSDAPAPDPIAHAVKEVEGTWRFVAAESLEEGWDQPLDVVRTWVWWIRGAESLQPALTPGFKDDGHLQWTCEVLAHGPGPVPGFTDATFRLYPEQSPQAIDLSYHDGTSLKGIYRVEQDQLIICVRSHAEAHRGRPQRFMATGDTGLSLLILRKVTSR